MTDYDQAVFDHQPGYENAYRFVMPGVMLGSRNLHFKRDGDYYTVRQPNAEFVGRGRTHELAVLDMLRQRLDIFADEYSPEAGKAAG